MSKPKPRFYTTSIDASKTVRRIQDMLAEFGADEVSVHYKQGDPSGLSFSIDSPGGPMPVTLFPRVEGIYKRLNTPRSDNDRIRKQATRTAWRQIEEYVRLQLELVESDQATAKTAFMPYLVTRDGRSFGEVFEELSPESSGVLALPPAGGNDGR